MVANIRLLKQQAHDDLLKSINANLDRYRQGDFSYLISDASYFIELEAQVDWTKISEIVCSADDFREVESCIAIFDVLGSIAPYLARDERLWVYLTHTVLLNYARMRWPIPSDDSEAVEFISTHFFAKGTRGIERDNAASRLWWMASLCNRVDGLTLEEALQTFLYRSDVRANIIERPTTSQTIQVFSALIRKLHESYSGDKALFERNKFRPIMKELNLQGGVKLLEVLDESSIDEVLGICLK